MSATGEAVSYRELDERSNQGAHLIRSLGLATGDSIAVLMDNCREFFEVAWAAQRSGLYATFISSKLGAEEIEYIVGDCGAKVFIASASVGPVLEQLPPLLSNLRRFVTGEDRPGYTRYETARDVCPQTPIADQAAGAEMLYSSGTTGRPKGVKVALSGGPIDGPSLLLDSMRDLYGFDTETVYLCPAPLYHAAPYRYSMNVQRVGGTVIVMEKFDAERALQLIERYRVTAAQFVPTHFVRMLKLPQEVRERYDVSSLRTVVHAAAPCPIPVKEQMIAWWGPILHEYYAGTEGNGSTYISSQEWLTHKGSVGRARLGTLRIVGEDGEPLPPRSEGVIYFECGPPLM
jgi:long-chain acyl-CoA synthetase